MRVTIQDVAYRGKGVARAEGLVLFVPHTLTGEVVEVEVTRRARNFAEARLLDVVQPSPARRAPDCPLNGACPGCCHRHAAYAEELRVKQAQLAGLLQRIAGETAAVLNPPAPSPLPDGYRNKITLHGAERDGRRMLGYFAVDNTTVMDVERCPLAMPSLNRRLTELRGDAVFMGAVRNHLALTLRQAARDGVCHWIGKRPAPRPWLTESGLLGDLHVPRGSFFQVNPPVADLLVGRVQAALRELQSDAALDMYCGVGVFALAAAVSGIPQVAGIESDPAAVEAAVRNAADRGLQQTVFRCGQAEKLLKETAAAMKRRRWSLIADPPRAGLSPAALRGIAAVRPDNLIYVSCAADTLARDVRRLAETGLRLRSASLFDMFPRTPYFETLAVLGRG